jgi:hypothetical protein
MEQKAQEALDVAAGLLAEIRARYDLRLDERLPGESPASFSGRYLSAVPTDDSLPIVPPSTAPLAPEATTSPESTTAPEPPAEPGATEPAATTAPETTTG